MRHLMRTLTLAGAVALAPTSAMAVVVSSNDGYGHQHWISHEDQSFTSTGKLQSTSGERVYYRGVVVYNSYPDYTCDRISPNTTSSSPVVRGGSCAQVIPIPPSADAAAWKICHDIAFFPDGCGSQRKQSF
jgi:hypothetical protein